MHDSYIVWKLYFCSLAWMSKVCNRFFTPCSGWCNPYLSLGLKYNLKKEFLASLQRISLTLTFESLRHSNHAIYGNWIVERAGDWQPAKSIGLPWDVWTQPVVLQSATVKFSVSLKSRTRWLSCGIKVGQIWRSRQELWIFVQKQHQWVQPPFTRLRLHVLRSSKHWLDVMHKCIVSNQEVK